MTIDLGYIATFIGRLILTTGGALWLASTKFGEKFLIHRFGRKLAELRHEQNEQIERLRSDLALLGDRGVRSNEREFLAITAVWEKFVDAWLSTQRAAVNFLQFPDFSCLQTKIYLNFWIALSCLMHRKSKYDCD